jgi:hypothetical protein
LFLVELLVSNELNSLYSFTHTLALLVLVAVGGFMRLEVGALEEAFGGYTRLELPLVIGLIV